MCISRVFVGIFSNFVTMLVMSASLDVNEKQFGPSPTLLVQLGIVGSRSRKNVQHEREETTTTVMKTIQM